MVAFSIQYGLYHRLLQGALRSESLELMRPAMKRWIKVAIGWQVVVLGACTLYMFVLSSRHGAGVAWISPAVGGVFGTALPLQFVVISIARSAGGLRGGSGRGGRRP